MEMTEKCKKEIEKLEGDINKMKEKVSELIKRRDAEKDYGYRNYLTKEINRIWKNIDQKENKAISLKEIGISTSEQTRIKSEATLFQTIKTEITLGSVDYLKVGFSKCLNSYVEVKLTKFSGFMSNVRGCAYLANKTKLNSVELITEQQFEEAKTGDKVQETYFIKAERKIFHPDGSVERSLI